MIRRTPKRAIVPASLQQASEAFAHGDFSAPMATHGEVPDGLPEMLRLQEDLSYKYVETDRGAKAVTRAANPEAREHNTGDPLEVAK